MFRDALQKLVSAAETHWRDSGDAEKSLKCLNGLLRSAWDVMTVSQKLAVLHSKEALLAAAAGDVSLHAEVSTIKAEIDKLDLHVKGAGYIIHVSNHGYFWEKNDKVSNDFRDYPDAVISAYQDMMQT